MKIYKCWDIPSTMLNTVKAVVSKKEEALIYLTNASTIEDKVKETIKKTNVKVIFREVK